MEYIGITAARAQLSTLVENGSRTIIVRKNTPQAVLIPFDDFRRLLLAQARHAHPEFLPHLLQQHDQVMSGEEEAVDFSAGTAEELLALAQTFQE